MRFGIVILPQQRWADAAQKWAASETLGFDHAWTYDHLSWRSLAGEPWGATIPTLVAAAGVTSTIRLGTFVSSPNYRHPVPFAKDVATLDDVSGGRFVLGVGSGGTGYDAFVLGQAELTPHERHERFAEFVRLLDELLRFEGAAGVLDAAGADPGIHFAGDWYHAVGARMVGAPAQHPRLPFVLAANGPKGLALVSRFGQGWVTTGADGTIGDEWWQSVAALAGRLDAAAESAGQDPATIDRYLSIDSGGTYALAGVGAFEQLVEKASTLGFTDVITHWPRADGIYAGSENVLEQVAARLDGWR